MKANGKLAVDSNAFIAYCEGVTEVCRIIDETAMLFMPLAVLGELLYGAHKSRRPEESERIVMEFFAQCLPINVDETVARRYATIRLSVGLKGKPIPENDLWIAASCLEADAALLSQDDHFLVVEGLTTLRWSQTTPPPA